MDIICCAAGNPCLQEVVWCSAGDMGLSSPWGRVKLKEGVLESIIQLHDGRLVATAVAIVGSTEDGHYVLVMTPVVALHDQLMGS